MNNLIKILPDEQFQNRITLSSRLVGQERKITYVRFGSRCCEVSVYVSPELAKNEALLSSNVIRALQVPLQPLYMLKIRQYEMEFGPYIGLLAFRKKANLDEYISNLTNYLYDYQSIGGAVLAFSAEGVDTEKQLIDGYIYNPDLNEWEQGLYPFPASLFKRAGMRKSLRDHFHSLLGQRIFNSYIFNKWEMHTWLSNFETTKPYLPETILYETAKDALWFLKTYNEAFIKPISGSQGEGILTAKKIGNHYVFKFREEGNIQKKIIETQEEAMAFMKRLLRKDAYIIQQPLSLLKHEDRVIDFRMLLVKDQNGKWEDFNLITRFGKSGSYVSNISDGGSAELAMSTFTGIFSLSAERAYKFRQEIAQVCIDAALNLEKCGIHVGNLGIDVAIDQDFKIWIIEINNKDPNHTISIDANDRQTFYQIKKANMLYAKFLAGFGEEQV
ncbi:YheC/YheD family endospore coat-associated protein [Dethiobacter alkaliphilus]|uniref:ATP-grasp domain-containing protein n=1 Tax=Dethiobacter alkaliphilus AHT 1 TaxID=555088 RepID=C0GCD9_DETAL|nr:YheC/YheD family protein [Dethiobacter alkaliphilus]EEG78874.1 hypothetical protein DealDRAFT_0148 [Dethiobacter alkaliphilus AHT 1]